MVNKEYQFTPSFRSQLEPGGHLLRTERARFGRDDRVNGLGSKDEDRVARRVRLVARDVEVADAERKVDRIEVLERGGQERQVQRDESTREGAGAEEGSSHRTRAKRASAGNIMPSEDR